MATRSSQPTSADAGPDSSRRRSPAQFVLAAGALAAAVGSVVGLGTTVSSILDRKTPAKPAGKVRTLEVRSVRSLTYGQSRDLGPGDATPVPQSESGRPGELVEYDVETQGFTPEDEMPVSITLSDIEHPENDRTFPGESVSGGGGDDCGCSQWVPVPRGPTRYRVQVAIYQPGPLVPGRQPVKQDWSRPFTGSGP